MNRLDWVAMDSENSMTGGTLCNLKTPRFKAGSTSLTGLGLSVRGSKAGIHATVVTAGKSTLFLNYDGIHEVAVCEVTA
jgi:hypothetical protein